MEKQELKENLLRRIKHLSLITDNNDPDEWGRGYDEGFRQACLQIIDMINAYK